MCNIYKTVSFKNLRGFSALELMVVLALIAIFTALALPSFEETLKRYRVDTAGSEIVNMLQFARAEAIRTRQTVTVAPVQNSNCADWNCGINVFDTNTPNNPLKTISQTDFQAVTVQLSTENSTSTVVYNPLGYMQDDTGNAISGTINIGPISDGNSSYTNTVCLDAGGGIHIISSANTSANTAANCTD